MQSTPNATATVVADLWERAIERAEGAPRSEEPTASSTAARWDAVITRVDGAAPEPAPTPAAAEAVSAWDSVIELVSGRDDTAPRSVGIGATSVAHVEWWR